MLGWQVGHCVTGAGTPLGVQSGKVCMAQRIPRSESFPLFLPQESERGDLSLSLTKREQSEMINKQMALEYGLAIVASDSVENASFAGHAPPTITDPRFLQYTAYLPRELTWHLKVQLRVVAIRQFLYIMWEEFQSSRLAKNMVLLSTAVFLITVFDSSRLHQGSWQMFAIIFEVVSAYGNVGDSVGAQHHRNCAYSGDMSVTSKMVIALVCLFGSARGVPAAVDGALTISVPMTMDRVDSESMSKEA